MQQVVSFWLIPREEEKFKYQEIITRLASEYDAPEFEPHITVFNGEFTNAEAKSVMEKTLIGIKPFRLETEELKYSDLFYNALYVTMKSSPILAKLSEEMRVLCKKSSAFVLHPHISLIYKKIPESTKKYLKEHIRIPTKRVLFDLVKAIDTPSPVLKRGDVERWRVIYTKEI